jgi:hypothetical protein
MLRSAHLSQKLTRPIPTKDGGTLRTVLDAQTYRRILVRAPTRRAWERDGPRLATTHLSGRHGRLTNAWLAA